MRYSVYVQQSATEPEVFLQSSEYLERIKKDKSTLDRWLYEMGVIITHHKTTKFLIYENGVPLLRRNLLGEGSRTWVKMPKSS